MDSFFGESPMNNETYLSESAFQNRKKDVQRDNYCGKKRCHALSTTATVN